MISEFYRGRAEDEYLSRSKDRQKLKQTVLELENFIINTINSKYSKRILDYVTNNPKKVILQRDIDLMWEISFPSYSHKYILSKDLMLNLSSHNLPRFIGDFDDALSNDSEFYNKNTEFCDELIKYFKTISKLAVRISSNVLALRGALAESSMNKTSIKKFYPELFEFMYKEDK